MREATGLAHRKLKPAWRAGRVRVRIDGQWAAWCTLGTLIYDEDEVFFDDVLIRPRPPQEHWLLHKPHGVFSTARDPHGRPDLSPWLEQLPQGVFPVGRLDRATTGALLLCDDGDLSHMLLTPDHHVDKTYLLTCAGRFDSTDPRVLALTQGVILRD